MKQLAFLLTSIMASGTVAEATHKLLIERVEPDYEAARLHLRTSRQVLLPKGKRSLGGILGRRGTRSVLTVQTLPTLMSCSGFLEKWRNRV